MAEPRVSEEAARDFANAMALYLATEHSVVAHRNDEDPTELLAAVERWVALARVINQRRTRLEQEILAAPVGSVVTREEKAR